MLGTMMVPGQVLWIPNYATCTRLGWVNTWWGLSPDVAQHTGKKWGELPGKIKEKIIQEMRARYGEDYARNIKLYFEQLAERK